MTIVELRMRSNFDAAATRVFRQAQELVKAALMKAHVESGRFHLTPREQHTWKAGCNNQICLRPSQGREIRVRVKGTGNGAVWDYALTAADSTIEMEHVRQSLEKLLGKEEINGHEVIPTENKTAVREIEMPPVIKPIPPIEPSPLNALAVLDQMRNAIVHRDQRLQQVEKCNAEIAIIETEIVKLQNKRDQLLHTILQLEHENSTDKSIKLAQEFSELMTRFGGPIE